MIIPNEETFKQWLADPVTQFVIRDYAGQIAADIKDSWANGDFTAESRDGTLQSNAEAIARCKAWTQLCELSYEDLITVMQDDQRRTANEPSQ